jgi:hypothetical protein
VYQVINKVTDKERCPVLTGISNTYQICVWREESKQNRPIMVASADHFVIAGDGNWGRGCGKGVK